MERWQLFRILTYTCIGIVVFLVPKIHSNGASPGSRWAYLKYNLTLTPYWWQTITINFSMENFESLYIDCLCNDRRSTCSFQSEYIRGLYGLPTTISDDVNDLSTWRIAISYEKEWLQGQWHWYVQYKLTRHNSNDSDLKCWKKEDRDFWIGNPGCSSKPQIVYLGGSRWLVIDDNVEVVTYKYDYDNTDCHYVGCMDDCGTTSIPPKTTTPPTVDSTENVVNITGNNTDIFIGNITNIIMGAASQTEPSSDQTPVIVGVVIAVLVVLILLAILAVILWRRKKSKQAEANPAFAASNPGAYVDAEFLQGGNAQSQATEGGNSQSVLTLPPPYSEVERNPQHGFTNDGYGVSGDAQI